MHQSLILGVSFWFNSQMSKFHKINGIYFNTYLTSIKGKKHVVIRMKQPFSNSE